MNSMSRRFTRPVVTVLAALAAMGVGLMAGADNAGAEQVATPSTRSEINGGGGSSDPEIR